MLSVSLLYRSGIKVYERSYLRHCLELDLELNPDNLHGRDKKTCDNFVITPSVMPERSAHTHTHTHIYIYIWVIPYKISQCFPPDHFRLYFFKCILWWYLYQLWQILQGYFNLGLKHSTLLWMDIFVVAGTTLMCVHFSRNV